MTDLIKVTAMVISAQNIAEYDKRLVLLTLDRGKITAFVHGVKRPGNQMMAAAAPFVFGEFMLTEGKSAYTVRSVKVLNYFEELRESFEPAYYGFYFLEFADYYGRENADDKEMLKLLYMTVKALCKDSIPKRLVRRIYELKLMVVNGEYPELFQCSICGKEEDIAAFSVRNRGVLCKDCLRKENIGAIRLSEAALYTLQYIVATPVKKLYTFTVSEEVLQMLELVMDRYRDRAIDRRFKSLEILETMIMS